MGTRAAVRKRLAGIDATGRSKEKQSSGRRVSSSPRRGGPPCGSQKMAESKARQTASRAGAIPLQRSSSAPAGGFSVAEVGGCGRDQSAASPPRHLRHRRAAQPPWRVGARSDLVSARRPPFRVRPSNGRGTSRRSARGSARARRAGQSRSRELAAAAVHPGELTRQLNRQPAASHPCSALRVLCSGSLRFRCPPSARSQKPHGQTLQRTPLL
jgi:hypothetical protein